MNNEPLAFRMRPTNIDEVIGQKHIIGEGTATYNMIKNGKVPSMLLYGEPGIGKTSIANAIAGSISFPFKLINATTAGKKDIEDAVKIAQNEGSLILAIDEVHRFNKLQQDTLLPHVESGLIKLIAMTTENPFHSVLPAIRSRCGLIKQLKRLSVEDVVTALNRALNDEEKGLGKEKIIISNELLEKIAIATNGEIRSSLTTLEMAFFASKKNEKDEYEMTEEILSEILEGKGFNHDKGGDIFYNLLSALQKSVRGSDTDAALFYLGRLIEGGDEKAIIRRLKTMAFEDIGITSKETVNFVCHACDSVTELGFPEARIPLANAVVALCLAPKSNSAYKALDLALADIRSGINGEIPDHLKDTHYASASKLGHGVGYLYPHNTPIPNFGGWAKQQYLPDQLKGKRYYQPVEAGQEKHMAEVYYRLYDAQNKKQP